MSPAFSCGRGDKIRTCDPIVPNDVRYQTALHLVVENSPEKFGAIRWLWNRDSNPNKQSQSLSCYRYTIPQNSIATERATVNIIVRIKKYVKRKFKFFRLFFSDSDIAADKIELLGISADSGNEPIGINIL